MILNIECMDCNRVILNRLPQFKIDFSVACRNFLAFFYMPYWFLIERLNTVLGITCDTYYILSSMSSNAYYHNNGSDECN